MLLDHAGLVVEPSAALGIAAILEDRDRFAGRHVVTIVCGSNVDIDAYHRWVGPPPLWAIQREVPQAIGDAFLPEARVPQDARRRRVTLLGPRDDPANLRPGPDQAADGHR